MSKIDCTLPQKGFHKHEETQSRPIKESELKRELEKYRKLIDDVSEPNCGRITELKEAIRSGTFLTKEAIQETAERIAARFLGKE